MDGNVFSFMSSLSVKTCVKEDKVRFIFQRTYFEIKIIQTFDNICNLEIKMNI